MTSPNDNAWEELFAKAANNSVGIISQQKTSQQVRGGGGGEVDDDYDHEETTGATGRSRKKRQKKKRNAADKRQKVDRDEQKFAAGKDYTFDIIYQTRNKVICSTNDWPSWIYLGGSFYPSDGCAQYASKGVATAGNKCCKHCGRSAVVHQVSLRKKNDKKKHNGTNDFEQCFEMQAVLSLRNIRCLAREITTNLTQKHHQQSKANRNRSRELYKVLKKEHENILKHTMGRLIQQLPSGECELLQSKMNTVSKYVHKTVLGKDEQSSSRQTTSHHQQHKLTCFENLIRLIIACDQLYYRVYYLQITEIIPMHVVENFQLCNMPHPSEYFGLDGFTQDAMETKSSLDKFKDDSILQDKPFWKWIEKSHDNTGYFRKLGDADGTEVNLESNHVLAQIWFSRFVETIHFFYNNKQASPLSSSSSPSPSSFSRRQIELALSIPVDSPEQIHETPAPPILAEWRDSCRDFVCNLYAYATIPPYTIQKINVILEGLKQVEIVDVGAGTGYMAQIFARESAIQNVQAYDIHPTKSSSGKMKKKKKKNKQSSVVNEYHGSTPPFFPVEQTSSYPLSDSKGKALLLSYPPPQSPMAYNMLKKYIETGGQCLIHIGEFKGLTGDSRFETYLATTMVCDSRLPCLNWGTDASEVTIWIKKGKHDAKQSPPSPRLLPCSTCRQCEGIKRCRLARELVYCSQQCFDNHATIRKESLLMKMIDIDDDEDKGPPLLDFANPQHFSPLFE